MSKVCPKGCDGIELCAAAVMAFLVSYLAAYLPCKQLTACLCTQTRCRIPVERYLIQFHNQGIQHTLNNRCHVLASWLLKICCCVLLQTVASPSSDFADFPQLEASPESEAAKFQSTLPRYQGVMADYLARMEAAQRKAEALEMQRQQHMLEEQEEQSIPSAASVAATAEEEELQPVQRGQSGPQGVMGDYMSRLQAARTLHERSHAKGKEARAVIPGLDTSDVNAVGAAAIDVVPKPEVSRGVNTQLAHLARVAAELKDLAGHVGQRAEGKQETALKPRKSRIKGGLKMQLETSSSNAAVQPVRQALAFEDFSSNEEALPDLKSD